MQNAKELLVKQFDSHWSMINNRLLKIITIFLLLSILWNEIFSLLSLPYSRANLQILIVAWLFSLVLFISKKFLLLSPRIMQHVVLTFSVVLMIGLYFGSGFSESWSFFLIIPLLAGVYGDRGVLFLYSFLGLICLSFVSIRFPISTIYDGIDVSNRILLFIILFSFSYLLFEAFLIIFGKQVSNAIDSMERTIEQVVASFNVAIEAKDNYTFGHSERVSRYAVEIAKHLPQYANEKKLKTLQLSGLLHDVGKINIPETILTKPGKLTLEEYEIIKTHPTVGARMVEKITGLGELKAGVLYHHERWDGKGYPAQLKGEEIPMDARILAISDALDAMTSTRIYRSALPFEAAYERLKENRGTQFDPHIIDRLDSCKEILHEIYMESHNEMMEFERLTSLL